MRRWGWPLGPASVVVPAVAIVVVVVGMTFPMLGWPYPLWVRTSAEFHQQFTWAGLIAATAACWYATLLHPRDRIWASPGARHIPMLVGWFVGAYLVALVPLVVSTVGGVGAPDPLAMLSGVLAMVAAVALGYALGTVVPSAVMVPVVAVGFYALLVAGSAGGERYATVAPVLYLEPELGQHESLPLLVFRIGLFVAVAVAAVALAGRRRGVIWFAVPVVLIFVSLVRQPVVFAVDGQPAPVCAERRGIRYCVHPDNQPRLVALVRTVDPLIARFGTAPANLDQVWDQALTFHPVDADIAWLDPDGTIRTSVADTVAGLYACSSDDRRAEAVTQVAADISDYLTTGTPDGTLAAMSVPELRQWIARHQEQLHTCTLTLDQLPGARNR